MERRSSIPEIEIPARLDQLAVVRSYIEQGCMELCVPDRICWVLVLAVDELCSNIIRHGYQGNSSGVITIRLERQGTMVIATLCDQSPAFDPVRSDSTVPVRLSRSGHGLLLANHVATIHYQPKSDRSQGNTTTISIDLESASHS
ncbi:MAG: hypothetical protein KatS3mg039_0674 [Candidatus Kapaibacterium sp.]|nr:MAG: hypothetical protein KatS3mg039_0674 [Candidatus Kapabacteria bacterium]